MPTAHIHYSHGLLVAEFPERSQPVLCAATHALSPLAFLIVSLSRRT